MAPPVPKLSLPARLLGKEKTGADCPGRWFNLSQQSRFNLSQRHRQISKVTFSKERQHVMLAKAVEFDSSHQNHLF